MITMGDIERIQNGYAKKKRNTWWCKPQLNWNGSIPTGSHVGVNTRLPGFWLLPGYMIGWSDGWLVLSILRKTKKNRLSQHFHSFSWLAPFEHMLIHSNSNMLKQRDRRIHQLYVFFFPRVYHPYWTTCYHNIIIIYYNDLIVIIL